MSGQKSNPYKFRSSQSQSQTQTTSESVTDSDNEFSPSERGSQPSSLTSASSAEISGRRNNKEQQKAPRKTKNSTRSNGNTSIDSSCSFRENPDINYIIHEQKCNIQEVAEEWNTLYENDKEKAMFYLFKYFLTWCGCPEKKFTLECFDSHEENSIIDWARLHEAETGKYPMKMQYKKGNIFGSEMEEFLQTIILKRGIALLDDNYFSGVFLFLKDLGDCTWIPTRHFANFAVFQLTTGVIILLKRLNKRIRGMAEGRNEIENLGRTITKISNFLKNMLKVYDSVCRDAKLEIRLMCVKTYNVWMQYLPSVYFDPNYKDYILQPLWDPSLKIKQVAFEGLLAVYQKLDKSAILRNRLTKVIVEYVFPSLAENDAIISIALLQICDIINQCDSSIFGLKHTETIYNHVYCPKPSVAKVAAIYVTNTIRSNNPDISNAGFLINLVEFYQESAHTLNMMPRMVKAFSEAHKALADFQAMCQLLQDTDLEDQKIPQLVSLNTCTITFFCNENADSAENSSIKKAKKLLTNTFGGVIVDLLDKFQDYPEVLEELLMIPRFFYIKEFLDDLDKMIPLLDKLCQLFREIEDKRVLNSISKTLEVLSTPMHYNNDNCITKCSSLVEEISQDSKAKCGNFIRRLNTLDALSEEDMQDILTSLRKLSMIFSCHDANKFNVRDVLSEAISMVVLNFQKITNLFKTEYVVQFLFMSCTLSLWWQKSSFEIDVQLLYTQNGAEAAKKLILNNAEKFIGNVSLVLANENQIFSQAIQNIAYRTMIDFFCAYRERLEEEDEDETEDALITLSYKIDERLNSLLKQFLDATLSDKPVENGHGLSPDDIETKKQLVIGYCKLVEATGSSSDFHLSYVAGYLLYMGERFDYVRSTILMVVEYDKAIAGEELFKTLTDEYRKVIRCNDLFPDVKYIQELAQEFSKLLKLNVKRDEKIILALKKNGISFAMSEERYHGFLKILASFMSSVSKTQQRTLLEYIENKIKALNLNPTTTKLIVLNEYIDFLRGKRKDFIKIPKIQTPSSQDSNIPDTMSDNSTPCSTPRKVKKAMRRRLVSPSMTPLKVERIQVRKQSNGRHASYEDSSPSVSESENVIEDVESEISDAE